MERNDRPPVAGTHGLTGL